MTQRRIYQSEFPYFITIKTKDGICFFDKTRYTKLLSGIIFYACRLKHYVLYAYCIMPDHLHLLVRQILNTHRTLEKVRWGGDKNVYSHHPQSTLSRVRPKREYTISNLIQSIKGNFSRKLHIGYIWQKRFNSRIVDTEERLINTIEYIENNPVNAGLPEKYSKFPYMYFNRERIDKLFYTTEKNFFNLTKYLYLIRLFKQTKMDHLKRGGK